MKKYKAALIGYYGFGNLGDELLLQACIDMFKRCGVGLDRIVVLSNNPEETAQSFHVASVLRWNFREVVKALRQSETLLLGGGGLLQDSSSVKSCVWYWGLIRLADFLGVKVWAVGQSFGPFLTKRAKRLGADAVRLCRKIHVRDEHSYTFAKNAGCKDLVQGHDLALTLKTGDYSPERKYMLVNLRPSRNLNNFIKILKPHVKNYEGEVIGAALYGEDEEALKLLKLPKIIRVKNFNDAKNLWLGASCAVGMRLHFGVLSRIFRTPLTLVPYDIKVSEFAKQSGVNCIITEWKEPLMPLEILDDTYNIDSMCKEILSL